MLPAWLQELAALTTVTLAGVWLVWRWLAIGKPRTAQVGCARCEHNPVVSPAGPSSSSGRGVRSPRLRVLGSSGAADRPRR